MKRISFTLLLFGILTVVQPICAQKILISYYSETGHTELLAKHIAEGAQAIELAEVRLLTTKKTSIDDLIWADAVIVGGPVHSGNIAAPVLEFIRTWPFEKKELKDKLGAAFVTAGGISAGEELALMNILHSMMVYNMIIVGGPTWDQPFGASAVTGEDPFVSDNDEVFIDDRFLKKGVALGERVAMIAGRLKMQD